MTRVLRDPLALLRDPGLRSLVGVVVVALVGTVVLLVAFIDEWVLALRGRGIAGAGAEQLRHE